MPDPLRRAQIFPPTARPAVAVRHPGDDGHFLDDGHLGADGRPTGDGTHGWYPGRLHAWLADGRAVVSYSLRPGYLHYRALGGDAVRLR